MCEAYAGETRKGFCHAPRGGRVGEAVPKPRFVNRFTPISGVFFFINSAPIGIKDEFNEHQYSFVSPIERPNLVISGTGSLAVISTPLRVKQSSTCSSVSAQ